MAHGFLSYQDNRGEVDYLGKIYRAIKDFLDEKDKREKRKQAVDEAVQEVQVNELRDPDPQLPGAETPLLTGGNQKAPPQSPPARRMLAGSALERSLPGSVAVNPTVVGGASNPYTQPTRRLDSSDFASNKIVDISSGSVTSYDPDSNFMGTSVSGGGTEEIVQAIDRLTFVTLDLVQAVQEQTRNDALVAQQQARQAAKIAEKSRISADKAAFTNDDFSGNLGYTKLAGLLGAGGRGGGGGLASFGAKAAAVGIGKAATSRGGARAATRLGAALGMKAGGKAGAKVGAKFGAKALGGVAGKKLPFGLGLAVAGGFAAEKFARRDYLGGTMEILSGLAAIIPGIGTAASLGMDGLIAARDFGLTPFAPGGIPLGQNVPALLNDRPDKAREAVMPLTDDTFLKFGEGYLNAMKKNKKDYAKLQAMGLEEYSNKKELSGGFNLFDPSTWGGGGDKPETDFKNYGTGIDMPSGTPGVTGDSTTKYNNYDFGHNLPPTNTLPGKQHYKAHRKGGRQHAGVDFDPPDDKNSEFASQLGGIVIAAGDYGGYYGNTIDIYNEKLDVTERIAEGDHIVEGIKKGVRVDPGQVVTKGSTRTGVFHYEIRKGKAGASGSIEGTMDPMEYLKKNVPKPPADSSSGDGTTPEPSGDGTPSAAESNYNADTALKPNQFSPRWAKELKGSYGMKTGEEFLFGPNKEYKATKEDKGFKFQKKVKRSGLGKLLGDWEEIRTSNGKNVWLKDMFLDAVKDKVKPAGSPATPAATPDASALSSAAADTATPLNAASSQTAAAAAKPPIVTVVTSGTSSSSSGGNRPADVPVAISSSDTGTSEFSKARTMLID